METNVLDMNIKRKPTHLETGIYRMPTTTDTTLYFESNHPIEHKTAAFRYPITRMRLLQKLKQQIIHKDQSQKLKAIIKQGQLSHITTHKYAKLLTYSKTQT
jgi:hypothetical protein